MTPALSSRSTLPPTSPDSLLKTHALRLGYNGRTVLDRVELEMRRGEYWFVIGPNGQGKTTLLQALLGRLPPLAGHIDRSGDFADPQRMGFVPQSCNLNPTLPTTVREFVLLGLVGISARADQRTERLTWALSQVGLAGMDSCDYWSLSGGQQQRALVARALVRRPHLLVADEPTSGMDLSVETAVYESLAELNRRDRLTVILVTHDLAVAARYSTHLALVHNGRVDAGPAADVLRPANLERAFGVPIDVSHDASGTVNVRLGLQGSPA